MRLKFEYHAPTYIQSIIKSLAVHIIISNKTVVTITAEGKPTGEQKTLFKILIDIRLCSLG